MFNTMMDPVEMSVLYSVQTIWVLYHVSLHVQQMHCLYLGVMNVTVACWCRYLLPLRWFRCYNT
jgi:hypothetical protein